MVAAVILGSWFLSEVKNSRNNKLPWYRPYLTAPGLLILIATALPLVLWIVKNGCQIYSFWVCRNRGLKLDMRYFA